ncbi:hypothetical protein D9M69_566720 [compost metagenome]
MINLLDCDRARPRLLHGRPDGLGVSRIGLVSEHKGPHRARGQQTHLMAELLELTRPPVGTAAGLDGHQTDRIVRKERQDFRTP